MQWIASVGLMAAATFWTATAFGAEGETDKSLTQQIFDTMLQLPGSNPAFRAGASRPGRSNFT
jgi:hypothetical protein